MRPSRFLPLAAFLILISETGYIPQAFSKEHFTFTAAGDCDQSANTTESLKLLAKTKPDLHLALGDLSYNKRPENEWCDYVKSYIGDLPFEILSGNHESNGLNGYIDNFVKGFPDKLGAVGEYGREYYFDYPADRPLARFILISPGVVYTDKGECSYSKGSKRYEWLSSAIDAARIEKISWVIIGMHKNCLSAGHKSCEIGEDVLNLLIGKKVDLILQGHEHSYQRSEQLSLGDGCPSVRAKEYNDKCTVQPKESSVYTKGDGTIIVIDGTFGARLSDTNTSRPDARYFTATMGRNKNPATGFMRYEVSENEIIGKFMRSAGENFEDSFELRSS